MKLINNQGTLPIRNELIVELGPGLNGADRTLKLWEMDKLFKCQVVGACLNLAEQRQLLKKSCISNKGKNLFEIHEIFVICSEDENKLSKRVDRLLRRKYLQETASLIEMDEEDFMEYWREYFEIGELGAMVYAAAARPGLSVESKKELFGLIHMNMHETANVHAALRRELAKANDGWNETAGRVDDLVRANRDLKKENKKLKEAWERLRLDLLRSQKENGGLREELDQNLKEVARMDTADIEAAAQDQAGDDETEILNLTRKLEIMTRANTKLQQRLGYQEKENALLSQNLKSVLNQSMENMPCDEACPSFDLCRKRILIVGGITKMENHYREVVESKGGTLEYHTGNLKNGVRELEGRFKTGGPGAVSGGL